MAMVTLANLGRLYGDVVERATLSRDLLAPAAARLPGDPSVLHHRCVLAQCIGFFRRPNDVRADLAPFGDVEGVAVCGLLHTAVVVFRTAVGAAAALQRRAETRIGIYYTPVPPLHLGFPSCFIQPGLIEVALYPPSVPASGEAASTEDRPVPDMEAAVKPRMDDATTAGTAPQAAEESRPAIVFLNTPPSQRPRTSIRGPPGTTDFVPFYESKLEGPRLGEDGRLWMDGYRYTYYEKGMQIDRASTQVIQVAPQTYYYVK